MLAGLLYLKSHSASVAPVIRIPQPVAFKIGMLKFGGKPMNFVTNEDSQNSPVIKRKMIEPAIRTAFKSNFQFTFFKSEYPDGEAKFTNHNQNITARRNEREPSMELEIVIKHSSPSPRAERRIHPIQFPEVY